MKFSVFVALTAVINGAKHVPSDAKFLSLTSEDDEILEAGTADAVKTIMDDTEIAEKTQALA